LKLKSIRILLLAVSCWLTTARAQWVETTITVPDSFVWQRAPQCVAFDNEAHVINYNMTFPVENAATFETDASQPGPRIRLQYTMPSAGVVRSVFSFAMPGAYFKPYMSGDAKRVKSK
jgi:hypothetical protein